MAFAPGFEVPDAFVEDVDRMTFSAYDDSPTASGDYGNEESLDKRMKKSGKPLLVLMGAEEQIIDNPEASLDAYAATVPWARTELIENVGHSPNVEAPARTAALLLSFAGKGPFPLGGRSRHEMQKPLQNRKGVRASP